ncbi:hypothetical protein [Rhizobium lusitanum]|nr:hypothetical protein [Rhizobium lusitanum]
MSMPVSDLDNDLGEGFRLVNPKRDGAAVSNTLNDLPDTEVNA